MDDVIVNVDGMAAGAIGLSALRAMLADPQDDRRLALSVRREGGESQLTLALRDLVPAQRAL